MNDEVRAELILKLRTLGWSWAAIGKRVNLSPNGAKYALMRAVAPGRYGEGFEEEVDHAPPPEQF